MASRATVQQAVELLKIHQIRRENAAIHEQFQKLQDEVSSLHDTGDDLRQQIVQAFTESQSAHALATKNQKQIDNVESQVQSSAQDKSDLHSLIQSTKLDCKKQCTMMQDARTDVNARLNGLGVQIEDTERKCRELHMETAKQVNFLTSQINQTLDPTACSTTTHERLCALEDGIAALQAGDANTASPSRIIDSVEGAQTLRVNDAVLCSRATTVRISNDDAPTIVTIPSERTCSMDQTSCHNGLDSISDDPLFNNSESTLPNDLDLDEIATSVSHDKLCTDFTKLHSPLVVPPRQDGAGSRPNHDFCGTAQRVSPYNRNDVLVAATDSLQSNERPMENKTSVTRKAKTAPQTGSRRSQRLIEKTQTKIQTQKEATRITNVEPQAQVSISNIAKTNGKPMTRCRSPKAEQHVKAVPPKDAFGTTNLDSAHAPGTHSNGNTNISKQRQSRDIADSIAQPKYPAARKQSQSYCNHPTHRITHRQQTPDDLADPANFAIQTPPAQPIPPPNSPHKKPPIAESLHRELYGTGIRAPTAITSPYNPRPRLVPQKRKPHSPVNDPASDPDGPVLPQAPAKRPVVLRLRAAAKGRQSVLSARETKPQGKMKVPVLWAAPVLSSSSEGERRFDRW